jgi:hypothetical protein
MKKKKEPKLKPEFNLGFISMDAWEVEHESDTDIQIHSIGHNRRLATINTSGLMLEAALANAELIGEAPSMLRLLKDIKHSLDNHNKLSTANTAHLKRIVGKFYTL